MITPITYSCYVSIHPHQASNSKLLRKHGYFDLLGCDFMLGDDNRLYLLEINTNPALSLGEGQCVFICATMKLDLILEQHSCCWFDVLLVVTYCACTKNFS